jgi:hypothetical protein
MPLASASAVAITPQSSLDAVTGGDKANLEQDAGSALFHLAQFFNN